MTLVSQIIADAYRESNLIAIGASPTAAEETEALRLLNRNIVSMFGHEFGEELTPLPFGKNNIVTPSDVPFYMDDIIGYFAPINARLICNLEAPEVVSLHPSPLDGARLEVVDVSENFNTNSITLTGNGRKIEGATSVTVATAGITRQWFYRDDLGEWVRLSTLIAADESPFPSEFDDLLITGLALRLSPRQGAPFSESSQYTMSKLQKRFRARYTQGREMGVEDGIVILSSNRRSRYTDSSTAFNRGR